jgi:hypothetical protein
MAVEDNVYLNFQDEAIRETLAKLDKKTKVFLNPEYDLKKTVENDADFLLGATFSEIIDHMNWLIYGSKTPKPTHDQLQKLNRRLFTMAPELKATIIKMVGL